MAPTNSYVYKTSVVNLGHVNMSHECKHTRTQTSKTNKTKNTNKNKTSITI